MTRDIDAVVEVKSADALLFAGLVSDAYFVSEDAVAEVVKSQRMFNVIHNEAVVKVDFMLRKSSAYRLVAFSRRIKSALAGFDACFVSREGLLLSRLLCAKDSRSELQLRDVGNLLAGECD